MPTRNLPRKLLAGFLLLSTLPSAALSNARQEQTAAVPWAASLEQALEQAAARKCPILLSYLGPWDAAADSPAARALAAPQFAALAEKQVLLRIHADRDEAARRARDRYRILTIPTFLVIGPDGLEVDRVCGYREGPQLAAELQQAAENPTAFGRLRGAGADALRTLAPEQRLQLIRGFRARMDTDECLRRIAEAGGVVKEWPAESRRAFLLLSAQCQLEAGRPAEALTALDGWRKLPEAAESPAELDLLRAEVLIELKRYTAAAEALAALSEVPDQELFLAAARLGSRLPAEAFAGSEGYWEVHRQAADALARGKAPEALQLAGQALEIAPFRGDIHQLLARIQLALAEKNSNPIEKNRALEKAAEELWVGRRLDPWNERTAAEASKQLAELTSRSGASAGAPAPAAAKPVQPAASARNESAAGLEAVVAALAANPDDPSAWRALQALGRAAGTPLERHDRLVPYELLAFSAEVSLEAPRLFCRIPLEARAAWREYAQTRRLYQAGKTQQIRQARAIFFLTAAEELRGLEAAALQWRAAREKDPGLKDVRLDLLCQLQSEKLLEAFVFVELFTEQFRPEFEQWKQRQPGKILEYASRRLLLQQPPAPKPALQLISSPCLESLPGISESARSLDSPAGRGPAGVLQTRRAQTLTLFSQAVAAHRANDLERAIAIYRQSLALEPNFSPAHQNLSVLYFNQGHLMQAAQHGERGALLEPGNPSLIYLATQPYIQLQLYDCALFCLRRALMQPLEESVRAALLDRLAYAHIQIREWSKAEQRLTEALALDGQNAEILRHAELLKRMRSRK